MSTVRVAVGVVRNDAQQVLITRRQTGQHLAGKWEFPGGKIEAGESCERALIRELAEEVGISVNCSRPLMLIQHSYPDKTVELNVQMVTEYSGVAHGNEGQMLEWVALEDLQHFDFPDANRAIIHRLLVDYSG